MGDGLLDLERKYKGLWTRPPPPTPGLLAFCIPSCEQGEGTLDILLGDLSGWD